MVHQPVPPRRKGKVVNWNGQRVLCHSEQIIVKLKSRNETQMTMAQTEAQVLGMVPGSAILKRSRHRDRLVVAIPPGTNPAAIATQFSNLANVQYAEPDMIDTIAVVPNDTAYGTQWGLAITSCPRAWDIATGNSQTIIGIVDSGVSMTTAGALDHQDANSPRYVLGTDFVDGDQQPRDLNGHGTHVLGIAAAESNNNVGVAGVDWRAAVYVTRVFDANGNGTSSRFADSVEEIVDFAVNSGRRCVINYSGSGPDNQTKIDACKYASDRGMILCAASGNGSASNISSPAVHARNFRGVISVGATTSADSVASFSNTGPELTVVAPGVGINSTTPTYAVTGTSSLNYGMMTGTSMATPFVAGLAAIIMGRQPGFANWVIRDFITFTAKRLSPNTAHDNSWGSGRIDAYSAVQLAKHYPSQVLVAVDGEIIYWVTPKGRFRRGKLRSDGTLKAISPDIDGPEADGTPSQAQIAVDGGIIYWVTPKGRFRRGKLNSEGRLKAISPDIDGPETDGRPSQVQIAVEGGTIYWVTPKGRFRRGKLRSDGTLKGISPDIDGVESDGRPSQVQIAVEGETIYWVTPKGRFRRGKLRSDGTLKAISPDIDGPNP